jgi:hypothetical protein
MSSKIRELQAKAINLVYRKKNGYNDSDSKVLSSVGQFFDFDITFSSEK